MPSTLNKTYLKYVSQSPVWFPKEFFFSRNDKSARITVVCKGKCFQIQLSPLNFCQSPLSLETYVHLMDSVCNDEDYDLADAAEEDLHNWAVGPFFPIFDQIDPTPSNPQPFTLRDYLLPETYRYSLYAINERLEPRFDYEVPRQPRANGVELGSFTLHPKWREFNPGIIEICVSDCDDRHSKFPRKVVAGGAMCFFKPLDYNDRRAAIREMGIYKEMENLGMSMNDKVRIPHFIGVVHGEPGSHIIGLLLSWVNCENETLQCSLGPRTPLTLRMRWDMQVTATLAWLHKAHIVWGDAKAANVLIDIDGDAWIIDFGGGYTRGWVEKNHMETIQGDMEGISKIRELLCLESHSEEGKDLNGE